MNKNEIAVNKNPLVKEVLTVDAVKSIYDNGLTRRGSIYDYVNTAKAIFTDNCNEEHLGYVVCHYTNDNGVSKVDYYFMEVTLEEVNNPFKTSHLYQPTFHMLLPISAQYCTKKKLDNTDTIKSLCDFIIVNATHDKWEYVKESMTAEELKKAKERDWFWYSNKEHQYKILPLTCNDIYNYWSSPLTDEEVMAKKHDDAKHEAELLSLFNNSDLPKAEDDAWYSILSMGYGTDGYDLESKVIAILRKRGFSVYIDGERDSFGWVTRGIFVNGELMAIY